MPHSLQQYVPYSTVDCKGLEPAASVLWFSSMFCASGVSDALLYMGVFLL